MSKRLVIAGIFLSSAFVDAPSYVHVGAISMMGALTGIFAASIALLVLCRPGPALGALFRLWPLSLLFALSLLQVAFRPFSLQAGQTLCLQWIFLGLIVLMVTGEATIDETSAARLLEYAALFASLSYLIVFAFVGFGSAGIGAVSFIAARSYALFALLGIALFSARWATGSRASLWLALAIIFLVALSLSRTALVVGVLLVPLSRLESFSRRSFKRLLPLAILTVIALSYLVFSIGALRTRFLGDNSIQDYATGEATVDTSGRLTAWAVTLGSYVESPWFGKGPGSANDLMDDVLYRLEIGHPLNEYLRFLHDEGLVGLFLFLLGCGQLLHLCWRVYKASLTTNPAYAGFYLATFLALAASMLTMLTDNTASYIFVMGPLGIMVGLTLRSQAMDSPAPALSLPATTPPIDEKQRAEA